MRKRLMAIVLTALVSLSIAGCGKSSNEANQTKNNKVSVEEKETKKEDKKEEEKGKLVKQDDLGFEYRIPDTWFKYQENINPFVIGRAQDIDYETLIGGAIYDFISTEDKNFLIQKSNEIKDQNELMKIIKEVFDKNKKIAHLLVFNKDNLNKGLEEGKKIEEITECEVNEKVAEQDKFVYYFSYDKYNDEDLSDESKKVYKEIFDASMEIKDSIKIYKPVTAEEKINALKNIEFKTKDIKGNEVSSDIFKDYKLTMINIWATSCGPCIQEMPDLQELYEGIKDENINLVGIVADTLDERIIETANLIVDKKGVKFTNLIPDENIKNKILAAVTGVPTTIFVDKDGNRVGEPYIGARSSEEYKKIIEEVLKELK